MGLSALAKRIGVFIHLFSVQELDLIIKQVAIVCWLSEAIFSSESYWEIPILKTRRTTYTESASNKNHNIWVNITATHRQCPTSVHSISTYNTAGHTLLSITPITISDPSEPAASSWFKPIYIKSFWYNRASSWRSHDFWLTDQAFSFTLARPFARTNTAAFWLHSFNVIKVIVIFLEL